MKRSLKSLLFLPVLLVVACGGSPGSGEDSAPADAVAPADQIVEASDASQADVEGLGAPEVDVAGEGLHWDGADGNAPSTVLNLATDADRNGKVSFTDLGDEELEEDWSLKSGAVFTLNLYDDDGDGLADALDDVVNGLDDARDLAPVYLASAPWLPVGATLDLTAENGQSGRLFRFVDDGWESLPLPASLAATELRDNPIILGFEGRDPALLLSPEVADRVVRLTLTARGAGGELLGEDFAVLHHAPLLLTSTLLPVKEVWALSENAPAPALAGLSDLLGASGVSLTVLDGGEGDPGTLSDRMEVVLAVRPDAKGHAVTYYPLLTASSEETLSWLESTLIGADIAPLPAPGWNGGAPNHASLSNIESSPVLLAGEMFLPYGRLYYGWNSQSESGPPEQLLELLTRQGLQGEPVAVDTSFLHGGHLSQVLSWVPYSGDPGCCGKGFRMLFADPSLAMALVDQWVADGQGDGTLDAPQGKISLATLAIDIELRAFNKATANELEDLYGEFLPEFGLEDEDVIRVPLLFFPHPLSGRAVPLLPAITEAFVVGKHYLAPAPEAGGGAFDLMAAWLDEALAPINAVVTFVPLPYPLAAPAESGDFGGLRRLLVGRRKPDNVEWWLWFM